MVSNKVLNGVCPKMERDELIQMYFRYKFLFLERDGN